MSTLLPDSWTLSELQAGDDARVTRILFSALRALCEDLGLRENESYHCRAATDAMLILPPRDHNGLVDCHA